MVQALLASREAVAAPRAVGAMTISTKWGSGQSRIDSFRTSGSTKVAFPRRRDAVEAILLNTSGGLTGGDRFENTAHAGTDSHLVLTTQAAERAYRSTSGAARVSTRLSVAKGATLHWLPQELIVFDGASLERRLEIELADAASAVIVEPVVFGRRAMGESQINGRFHDQLSLEANGRTLCWDRIRLDGDMTSQLARPAVARGMTALASAFYFGPLAEILLPQVRSALPEIGGASLIAPDLMAVRVLDEDSFLLRAHIIPVLETLTQSTLPKSWSL